MDEIRSSKRRQNKQTEPPDETIDQLNVRYRICDVFKAKPRQHVNEDEKLCECGYKRSEHRDQLDSDTEWSMSRNTLEQINSAYGRTENGSLFVRLDMDTPLEKVEKILLDVWHIPKPRFIVSIIGGTKYFKLSDRLETNFINGIVDIADKSDAWLLTNGYNVGIVQLVGQAISKVKLIKPEQNITAIGICKWGSTITNNSQIMSKEKLEGNTTELSHNSRKRRHSGEWEQEKNHSHYLMLDDGTKRKYETKDYRTRLAIHMARLQRDDDVTIPAVTLVVEGGKDTIANVYYDLRENVPVVLVNGSGRAADFLTRWLALTKDHDYRDYDPEMVLGRNELEPSSESQKKADNTTRNSSSNNATSTKPHINSGSTKLEEMFKRYRNQIKAELKIIVPSKKKDPKTSTTVEKVDGNLIRQVMFCLQPTVRSDITVFNLNSGSDLSDTIFRSICSSRQKLFSRKEYERNDEVELNLKKSEALDKNKRINRALKSYSRISEQGQKAEATRLLDLAMDWDCVDVAKEFIFRNSLKNIMHKEKKFRTALRENVPTFVYEFLKLKIDLFEVFLPGYDRPPQRFQYKSFIENLYTNKAVNDHKHHLRYFIVADESLKEVSITNVEDLNRVLSTLIGDYMHHLYYDTLEEEEDDRNQMGLKTILSNEASSNEQKKEIMRNYFLRDLFLWAVMMNFTDMAKVFLSHMKYRICPALIATKILRQYYNKATYGDAKKKYQVSMDYFEQYAMDCIVQCGDRDDAKACEIVLQRNELYGYVTCLQVAADARDKRFLATKCCVEAVNHIWYNKLNPNQSTWTHKISMLIGILTLGVLAPIFVSYRTTEKVATKIDRENRKFESCGIDYSDPTSLEFYTNPPSDRAYKRYLSKLVKFHLTLPMKFFYHLVTYLFFLLLFSYVLLFDFDPPTNQIPSIHWTEVLTILLVSCMLIEEIHQFFRQENLTWSGRVLNYFSQLFKVMGFIGFVLFYVGLVVRFTYASSEVDFTAARIIMAIDVEIWWLRLLSFIIVLPFLGPHIVSITKMLKDLLFFMCIIAVVMIGYGVASRSMAYYPPGNNLTTRLGDPIDPSFDGRAVFRQVLYPVYYLIYTEYGSERQNLDNNPDSGWSIATYVLLAIHMMFVNILLTNLLIALFSKRFQQVYEKTKIIWHAQNYDVTREYYTRSPFFPPFSLFYDLYVLCRMFFFFIRRKGSDKSADYVAPVFQIVPIKYSTIKEWREFEAKSTHEYAHNAVKIAKNASAKSISGGDTKSKQNVEATLRMKSDTNNTIDALKQVKDSFLNLNKMVDEMRERLEEKNKDPQKNE